MKLNELVFLRNKLQTSIDVSKINYELEQNQANLNTLAEHANDYYKEKILNLSKNHSRALEVLEDDINTAQNIINEINLEIFQVTRRFFEDNYQKECFWYDPKRLREVKQLVMADGSLEHLLNRIYLRTSWQYPALELGCRDGEFTKYLVAADPLYISDIDNEFLSSAISQFTPEYQARVRKYLIGRDFHVYGLPINQFGFIFSFNFFNYLSLDTIKQFLLQANQWLRPGGIMLFTYNNADISASAGLAEDYFMTYVPKSMLVPMIESLGFEIVDAQDHWPSTSWIEIKKPGTLKTVKAHQALGEIKNNLNI